MSTNTASRTAVPATLPDMSAEKTQEVRVRRRAERQGLRLEKSRTRDPRALDYGTYRLVDAHTESIVLGSYLRRGYGATLDQCERYLLGERDL